MAWNNDDYIDVAQRITDFKAQHPDGSLQPADLNNPYSIETIKDQTYIVVVAAAYRTPDDPRPGIGMAYEVFPGKTNFTRGSELQNAETSAWGRAIVAALRGDTKKSIASAEEVRNRREEQNQTTTKPAASIDPEMFAQLSTRMSQALTIAELQGVSKDVAGASGMMSAQQVSALQELWRQRNTFLVIERLDAEIQKVADRAPAVDESEYRRVLKEIEDGKLDEDTTGDLIRQLDQAYAPSALQPEAV